MHTLSVCRTCPRDTIQIVGPRIGGVPERVRSLFESAPPAGFRLLQVECLGGCPRPSAVALDGPDKWRLRLSGLNPEKVPDLMIAAATYRLSPDGNLADADLPASLRGSISARSPKRIGPPRND